MKKQSELNSRNLTRKPLFSALLACSFFFAGIFPQLANAECKFEKPSAAVLKKGKEAYAANCVTCHGEDGKAATDTAKALNPPPRNLVDDKFKKGEDTKSIFETITNGLEGTAMTSYAHISEEERCAIAHHIAKDFRKKADGEKEKKPAKKKKG